MYDGYSAASIRGIMKSEQGELPPQRFQAQADPLFLPVKAKIHELSLARLESMHLPPGVLPEEKLAQLETQMWDVTYAPSPTSRELADPEVRSYDVAVKLVAKMDSVAFLRFFGVGFAFARTEVGGLTVSRRLPSTTSWFACTIRAFTSRSKSTPSFARPLS